MNKPLLLFQAPVQTRSGYGSHSRDLVRSLIKSDKYDVRIGSLRWGDTPMNALDKNNPNDKIIIDRIMNSPELPKQPDIHIHVGVPNEFQPIAKYNIGITAGIETTMCSAQWIEGLNRMDLIIVPSKHSKNVFTSTIYTQKNEAGVVVNQLKCTKPIEVVFEGVDTTIFRKVKEVSDELKFEMDQIKENFNFLYVGHWLKGELGQDRKDTGMLVKVFLETYKNQKNAPGLIMKSSGATFSIMDKYEMFKKIDSIKNSIENAKSLPSIYILHGDLTDEEMNQLYNHPKVKAHITLTKGEGFGRPLLEATMSEKIVMAPKWSGHIDFLSENSVLFPGGLTTVHPSAVWENVIIPESKWFTVNYPTVSKTIQDVRKNYKSYKLRAKKQALISGGKFSLKKMDELFIKVLDTYIPEFPDEVKLKLPKLKKVGDKTELPEIKLPKLKMPTLAKNIANG